MANSKIKFIASKVKELRFTELDEDEDIQGLENNFSLEHTPAYHSEDDKTFIVKFTVNFISVKAKFSLYLEYYGVFETFEPIDDAFKESPFPIINAPAIVYPYLRSFVSTVTINSGLEETVILPTINFVELASQQIKKSSKS